MAHSFSVFANSCIKVPVDPVSKMPKTNFERRKTSSVDQCSIDSTSSICSATPVTLDGEKLKDFYRSIPDYNDIHHLPPDEFYSTLKILREKKKIMLGYTTDITSVTDTNGHEYTNELLYKTEDVKTLPLLSNKKDKTKSNQPLKKYSAERSDTKETQIGHIENEKIPLITNVTGTTIRREPRKTNFSYGLENDDKFKNIDNIEKSNVKTESKPRRNHSACSISWNDSKLESRDEVDQKFDQYFEGKNYSKSAVDDEFKVRSMPSSPMRYKRAGSPLRRRKSLTIPKAFKMTERDEDNRIVNELRSIRKSFSDDMLHQKRDRKHFRARPVPIESRIPLYDRILEDQAMRRAITKINSEAELRAQIAKREEKSLQPGVCQRAVQAASKPKRKKKFRARPVPKNLFSNYIYDKMKEDDFFRTFNRRIRAEEMLRNASLPGSMAARDRSRLSTPAAHSDLPIDPSPPAPSVTSSDRLRTKSPIKNPKIRQKNSRQDFITTCPQPFHLNTADRAAKKMEELTKKIYQESKSTPSVGGTIGDNRTYSALDLRATGRSNLAALLRAEAVRNKFNAETARRLAEQRRKMELKARDRILRTSNPAWHLVKNNHEEDIALRLQTRRDEERMRREEFLHEMELMYGRVQQQPMLFERYYAPRSHASLVDSIQLSPRKRRSRKNSNYHFNTPDRSRKVSINDTPEMYNGNVMEYIKKMDNNDKYSDSDALDSLEGKS